MHKTIEKPQSNNINVGTDVEKLIESKVNNGECLLDKLLLTKSADEKSISDDIINEELTFFCFTVC